TPQPKPQSWKVFLTKPQSWKVFLIIGIVVILGILFHTKKSSIAPPTPPPIPTPKEKKHRKEQPIVEQPKQPEKKRDIRQPVAVPNLNEERERMRREAER